MKHNNHSTIAKVNNSQAAAGKLMMKVFVKVNVTGCYCRLMGLVCSHRVEFTKAAPYIVADYCMTVQNATLYPPVKVCLPLFMLSSANLVSQRRDGERARSKVSIIVTSNNYQQL